MRTQSGKTKNRYADRDGPPSEDDSLERSGSDDETISTKISPKLTSLGSSINTKSSVDQECLFFHSPKEIQNKIIELTQSGPTRNKKEKRERPSKYSSESSEEIVEEYSDLFSFLSSCKSAYQIILPSVQWVNVPNLKQKTGSFSHFQFSRFHFKKVFPIISLKGMHEQIRKEMHEQIRGEKKTKEKKRKIRGKKKPRNENKLRKEQEKRNKNREGRKR